MGGFCKRSIKHNKMIVIKKYAIHGIRIELVYTKRDADLDMIQNYCLLIKKMVNIK